LPAALEAEGEHLLVFEAGGALAGGARLVVRNARSRIGEVRSLMVDPALRGRGLGVVALLAVVDWAFGTAGMHRLEGEVLAGNAPALRAFSAAGFEREGVRRRAYLRDGEWRDSVLFGLVAD
jgi:putative acetyltransferase